MRPSGSAKSLEERRYSVADFLKQNLSLQEIARQIGCHPTTVMRWRNALLSGGQMALKAKPVPGRPSRLTSKEKKRLVRFLIQGALAHGYPTEVWTTQRIADLIERRWGVKYHRNHVAKILHQMGWRYHKPEHWPFACDEAATAEQKQPASPPVIKAPQGWQPISSSSGDRSPLNPLGP